MSGERGLGYWDDLIEFYIERGYADDEIVDEFDREARRGKGWEIMFTRSGEYVDWGTLHGRRTVLALLTAARGATRSAEDVSAEDVRAMERKLAEAGQPHGIDSLATALHVSPATIRRRLGRIK